MIEARSDAIKEQYCMETWNVRSMNKGKLEVVKQEMARVNVDILGISELKWTAIGEFHLSIFAVTVVFEITPKYCISDSFVDSDGYSFSSKRFLPTVVDIMVI